MVLHTWKMLERLWRIDNTYNITLSGCCPVLTTSKFKYTWNSQGVSLLSLQPVSGWKYCTFIRQHMIVIYSHTQTQKHTPFRTVSGSPFKSSAQFSEDDFCSKHLIPDGTAYSKSCNKMYRKCHENWKH